MNTNGRVNHQLNYVTANRFYVEIGGDIKASFSECSGLKIDIDHSTVYFEGGVNDQQRILLGHAKFSDVSLKRGLTQDTTFLAWISDVLDAKLTSGIRRNVNILLFNQSGETQQTWTLIGAVPVGWTAPSLQANGNAVAIEQLTLAHEGLKIQKSGTGAAPGYLKRDSKSFSFPSN
jgi:phage tail-like protein